MWLLMNQPCWNKDIFKKNDMISSTLQHVEFEKVQNDPTSIDVTDSDSQSIEDKEEVLTQESSQQEN